MTDEEKDAIIKVLDQNDKTFKRMEKEYKGNSINYIFNPAPDRYLDITMVKRRRKKPVIFVVEVDEDVFLDYYKNASATL